MELASSILLIGDSLDLKQSIQPDTQAVSTGHTSRHASAAKYAVEPNSMTWPTIQLAFKFARGMHTAVTSTHVCKLHQQQAIVMTSTSCGGGFGDGRWAHRQEETKQLVCAEHKARYVCQVRHGEDGGGMGGHEGEAHSALHEGCVLHEQSHLLLPS